MTLLGRAKAAMAQTNSVKIPSVEVGFTMCRTGAGALVRGPLATGTRTRLNIPISCPPGSVMEGLFHTHPGGQASPSQRDVASAKQYGAKVLCITNDTTTRCFRVTRRSRS